MDPAAPIEDALASVRALLGTDDPVPADTGRLPALHAEMAGHSRALISLIERRYARGRGLSSQQRRLVSRAGERSRRSAPIVPDTAAVIELVKLAEMVQDLAMLAGQSRRVGPSTPWRRVAGDAR
ncbi:hypothetical protein ACFWPV_12340 [Streptomyces uncialis]|uniref:hypothetical protein n=1 Tax=Streptomyces uncialis TaxID=1048205 RepID=UPI0036492CD9